MFSHLLLFLNLRCKTSLLPSHHQFFSYVLPSLLILEVNIDELTLRAVTTISNVETPTPASLAFKSILEVSVRSASIISSLISTYKSQRILSKHMYKLKLTASSCFPYQIMHLLSNFCLQQAPLYTQLLMTVVSFWMPPFFCSSL